MTPTSSPPVLLPVIGRPDSSSSWLAKFSRTIKSKPDLLILLLVVLIGGGTGLSVVLFHYLIEAIHSLTLEQMMGAIAPWGAWTLALVPTLGGVVVGLMRWWLRDFGPGISAMVTTQASEPIALVRPAIKMTAASVSLGTGASLGPEGPSVEIGANIGMVLAQMLRVSQERRRLLLGAGAAAGLAAGFNAPIAGVFLSLELVLSTTFATTTVGAVLLSAVVAALITQIGLGSQPAFALPVYEVRSPWELPLYVGLGILASGISLIFVEAIKFCQQLFEGQLPGLGWVGKIPLSLQPVIGGGCVGLVALAVPQVLGIGYETVEAVLRNVVFSLPLLLLLLLVKLMMTAISLGSGLVGGIFAPSMFLGATLGAAYGQVMALLLPPGLAIAAPPAYAMVGMAAVLAGSTRSPLTAILLLFELTRDYRIILPLMAAVGISVLLVEWLKPKSSNGLNLQQMGLNLEEDQTQSILENITVAEVMEPDCLCLPVAMGWLEAGQRLIDARANSALVINAQTQLVGIFTLQDFNRTMAHWQSEPGSCSFTQLTLADLCSRDLVWISSQASLVEAIQRMKARGLHQLPVIREEPPEAVLGVLTSDAIVLACKVSLARHLLEQHLVQPQLSTLSTGVHTEIASGATVQIHKG
uniref:Chloride channel core n=1 Tax=Cyanothece sp. (strain PCC 7425 / ATCC 29141) TaxID=395961 RepID=B8HWS8_CYAP4